MRARAFCQMLYETGVRSIEAWNLKWCHIDFDRKMVSVTPAKNGNARDLPLTDKLVHMLGLLPRESMYVFRKGVLKYFQEGFRKHREKLAVELNEPEILKCSFKTFRTFYGTKCSYKFRDPFEVKYRMGHVQMRARAHSPRPVLITCCLLYTSPSPRD